MMLSVVGVAALSGAGLWTRQLWERARRTEAVRQRLTSSGWSEPLFDGRSLKNWQARSGVWQLVSDDDNAPVLAGTNGVIVRKLIRSDVSPPRPLEHAP